MPSRVFSVYSGTKSNFSFRHYELSKAKQPPSKRYQVSGLRTNSRKTTQCWTQQDAIVCHFSKRIWIVFFFQKNMYSLLTSCQIRRVSVLRLNRATWAAIVGTCSFEDGLWHSVTSLTGPQKVYVILVYSLKLELRDYCNGKQKRASTEKRNWERH